MRNLFTFLFFSYAYAEGGCQVIAGPGLEDISSVLRMNDGGYLLVGLTSSYGNGKFDVFLVKLDANFNREWQRTIGTPRSEAGRSIINTSDGGYLIIGSAESPIFGEDAYILKLNNEFDLQWIKAIDGYEVDTVIGDSVYTYPTSESGIQAFQTNDGGYILFLGRIIFFNQGKISILKLSSTGNIEWMKTSISNNIRFTSNPIKTTDGGYVFLLGNVIVKLDSLFNVQWTKRVTNLPVALPSIIQTNDNGYAITGQVVSNVDTNILAMKLDASGNVQWSRAIGGARRERGYMIIQTNDNGYFVAGVSNSYTANGTEDIYVVKLDSSGEVEWVRALGIGPSKNDYPKYVMQLDNGGYAVFGGTDYEPEGILIITLDENGNTCSQCTLYSNYYMYSVNISLSPGQPLSFANDSARIWTGGTLLEGGFFTTNVICSISDITESDFENKPSFCYSRGRVKISFNRVYDRVEVVIRDIAGREIDKRLLMSIKQAEIDIKGKDGIYFVEVRTNDKKAVYKVVKVK